MIFIIFFSLCRFYHLIICVESVLWFHLFSSLSEFGKWCHKWWFNPPPRHPHPHPPKKKLHEFFFFLYVIKSGFTFLRSGTLVCFILWRVQYLMCRMTLVFGLFCYVGLFMLYVHLSKCLYVGGWSVGPKPQTFHMIWREICTSAVKLYRWFIL